MAEKSHEQILFCAQRFPPGIGGTPTVMRNLCEALPASRIMVASMAERGESDAQAWRTEFPQLRLSSPDSRLRRRVDPKLFSYVQKARREIRAWAGDTPIQAVVSVFPNCCLFLAGWRLARQLQVPFFPYFMDMWSEHRKAGVERLVARWAEPRLFRDAAAIFCISPALAKHYQDRFPGSKVICIPHIAALAHGEIAPSPKLANLLADIRAQHDVVIAYTGQVYGSTGDPFHILLRALKQTSGLRAHLVVSTPDPPDELARYGLMSNPRVTILRLETENDVRALQRSADILYNPVSFTGIAKPQVQTLMPTKTFEYLAAGRPILVHGPAASAFVEYARQRNFAEVVDVADATVLADAICRLAAGREPEARHAARQRELAEHRPQRIAELFMNESGKMKDEARKSF